MDNYINPSSRELNQTFEQTSQELNLLQIAQQNLNPHHIQATIQYLRNNSSLVDLVAIQISKHFVEVYRQKLTYQMRTTNKELDESRLPYFQIVPATEKTLIKLKTNLDSEALISQTKKLTSELFEKHCLWEESAREIWANLAVWVVNKIETEKGLTIDSLGQENFNNFLFEYVFERESKEITNRITRLEEFYSQSIARNIIHSLDLKDCSISTLEGLLGLKYSSVEKLTPATEVRLSKIDTIAAIPTGLPIVSSISAQLQTTLWKPDSSGIAHFRYHSKNNQNNYIEHYITTPGDIETLPWEAAEQIINKYGFNTVKLQFILAAHAMRQAKPWESTFTLKATDIVAELGWDKSHHSDLPTKRNEVASIAYALSCLLVKAVWIEGRGTKQVDASTPVGRMWEVLIDAHGQFDWIAGKIEKPDEVFITIRPGLWTAHFLNQAGSKAREALYQFGYLALNILKLDPYHDELTLRLAIHLTLDVRIRARDRNPHEYKVKTLLEAVLPIQAVQQARQNREKARSLFERWNCTLKLLVSLGWRQNECAPQPNEEMVRTPVFYANPYPEWLSPENKIRKPKGWVDHWLEQKLIIKPPHTISQRMVSLTHFKKTKQLEPLPDKNLTGEEVKAARKARKWTQAKLAGTLKVHQSLIAKIESGDRQISPELETLLRRVLDF